MIRNLGKAIGILLRAQLDEDFAHRDVDVMYAPAECHGLVARGEAERLRLARRHAEAVARRPLRIIRREAKRRGLLDLNITSPRFQRVACRLMYRYPF